MKHAATEGDYAHRRLDAESVPTGTVTTRQLQGLLEAVLGRRVERHEILNLKIKRDSSEASDMRQSLIKVKLEPTETGPRNIGLWGFAELVRIACILQFHPTHRPAPRVRAAIWLGLTGEAVGGLVSEIRSGIEEPEQAGGLSADLQRYIVIPQDDSAGMLLPVAWDEIMRHSAAVIVNVTNCMVRAMVFWGQRSK